MSRKEDSVARMTISRPVLYHNQRYNRMRWQMRTLRIIDIDTLELVIEDLHHSRS